MCAHIHAHCWLLYGRGEKTLSLLFKHTTFILTVKKKKPFNQLSFDFTFVLLIWERQRKIRDSSQLKRQRAFWWRDCVGMIKMSRDIKDFFTVVSGGIVSYIIHVIPVILNRLLHNRHTQSNRQLLPTKIYKDSKCLLLMSNTSSYPSEPVFKHIILHIIYS